MTELSPRQRLYDLMNGALVTRALGLAADLGVARALAGGPRSVEELAAASGANADALHRILRALASNGIFEEVKPRVFANTDVSALLLEPGASEFAHLFGGIFHRAAGELDASGEATFPREHGEGFWEWLAAHPDDRAAFDTAMVDGVGSRVERIASVEWRGDETVVDVGGGNGSLLLALLPRLPDGVRGIVLDLPETVRDDSSFGDRIEFVGGSFFESVPRGDVYVLGTILHNWSDEDAARILTTIRTAAPKDARLLVIDGVLPSGNERNPMKWLDLLMLALFTGRERDEAQWRALFAETGFEPVSIRDGLIEAVCR
ncbi:MAG TPA: methyltransferase [Gaiellaceae bacterium]|nr:methyltransferase [Gaiellaceae bacterium]